MIAPEVKEAWAKYKSDDWSGCGVAFAAYIEAEAQRRKAEWDGCLEWNHLTCCCRWTDEQWRRDVIEELEK